MRERKRETRERKRSEYGGARRSHSVASRSPARVSPKPTNRRKMILTVTKVSSSEKWLCQHRRDSQTSEDDGVDSVRYHKWKKVASGHDGLSVGSGKHGG
ncbi:hypothetical protein M8C21_023136 [Ambrosia artemisiifolia]|uniref:Uncharacterized protein n=1 Tax=Ambrosia artemisiifolia TaxID=4212 RepID=A0AAD5G2L5_AMBAR|nr:hypothetical protein M8C21_023136 [Ambrosia artemisiifolia]